MIQAIRTPLPERRESVTRKVAIGGKTLYMTCGHYEDGSLGEIFLNYPRSGVAMQAMLGALAQAISINLQYGITLERVLHSLRDQDFLPQGPVSGSENVTEAKSLIDYIVQELRAVYLEGRGKDDVGDISDPQLPEAPEIHPQV